MKKKMDNEDDFFELKDLKMSGSLSDKEFIKFFKEACRAIDEDGLKTMINTITDLLETAKWELLRRNR